MAATTGTLPRMRFEDNNRKSQTINFGGINHTMGARDGDIWYMENMTSDNFPVLGTRPLRYELDVGLLSEPNGLYGDDGLFWVDGSTLYRNGKAISSVTLADSWKTFASLGPYIVILPDKVAYNRTTGEAKNIEATWTGGITIQDGTYAEETAKANTIYAAGANWSAKFSKGDAVTIEGCTVHEKNNFTPIIREISGDYLRFYENTFVIGEGGDTEASVTIKRTMPEMDFLISNENRLWGCKGDTIYASKLGDPFNWNVFDGVATDSYAVEVGSPGDFTAAFSYLGYPVFFKEDHIYKVYGYKPSNFQVMASASLGVAKGQELTLAIAGEILFYVSRVGVVAYSGGIPQKISGPLGLTRISDFAAAGSDGRKYYLFANATDYVGTYFRTVFVYDTETKLWHQESPGGLGLAWTWDSGGLYYLTRAGRIWLVSGDLSDELNDDYGGTPEEFLPATVEFADFTEYSPDKKGVGKILVRMETEGSTTVTVRIMYDSDGFWHDVRQVSGGAKRSEVLPIVPRRCDHYRLRFVGTGAWYLHSLTRQFYTGSDY